MGRPREHGAETRAALLREAAAIVGAEGASGVTVRRVADRAGTSTRAVYSLFGGKDGLLRELFCLVAEGMRRHHEAVPVDRDPVREISQLALAYRTAALEQPYLYDFFFDRLQPAAAPSEQDAELAWLSFARVLDAVDRCETPGRDAAAVGLQLWALVHGLVTLELRGILGDEQAAIAHWRDAVTAAVTGYRQAPAEHAATARK